jgi:hypothetical protein
MEENICNRCVKQSVCKNYIKGQNVVGCIEFLSIKRTDYLTDDELLDKIRAEIERERSFQRAMDEYDIATGLRKALEIIDNYKAEREDKK